jgi:hypothetical protein
MHTNNTTNLQITDKLVGPYLDVDGPFSNKQMNKQGVLI